MEPDPKQTMPEVSGDRTFIETQKNYLANMIVWAMSGCIVGISMGQWITTARPADHAGINGVIIIAIVLVQFVWLTRQFLKMRKWREDLRADRLRLLETWYARVDEMLPDDPIQAARLKMQMEEQWPRL